MATFMERLIAIEAATRQANTDQAQAAGARKEKWNTIKNEMISPAFYAVASRLRESWRVDAATVPKNGNAIELVAGSKANPVRLTFEHADQIVKCSSDDSSLREEYEIDLIDEEKIQEKVENFYRHVLEKLKLC